MRNVRCQRSTSVIAVLAVVSILSTQLFAGAPRGWYLAGSKPADYDAGIDPQITNSGSRSAYLKARQPNAEGFGTLMQDFRAEKYLGKRVRLSASVKTEAVSGWAALWMRVDKGAESVAFDNMQDRPLKGTTDWRNYQVVLDVPQDATEVFIGVLLGGPGTVWLSNVKVEIVGPETPITGKPTVQRTTGTTCGDDVHLLVCSF